MRTTINLDDDALKILREYSQARSLALGKAASELLRRGAASPTPMRLENGFMVFDISPGGPKITSERVRELLESDLE